MTPRRIVEHPGSPLHGLLRAAEAGEPPPGSCERIWRRIREAHAPLAESDAALAGLLDAACEEEPAGARERVWLRLCEKERGGATVPARLVARGDALGRLLYAADVPAPPPGREARIWARLTADPRRLAPRFALAAGLAAAAALALAFWPEQPAELPAAPAFAGLPLRARLGATLTLDRGAAADPADPRMQPGDTVRLARGDEGRFELAGVARTLLLGQGARLALARSAPDGVRLQLLEGVVAIHAAHRPAGSSLVVAAGAVEVKVVGTRFAVENLRGRVGVWVREGVVEVRHGGRAALLRAGDRWTSGGADAASGEWARAALDRLADDRTAAPPPAAEPAPERPTRRLRPTRAPVPAPMGAAEEARGEEATTADEAASFDPAAEAARFEAVPVEELAATARRARSDGDVRAEAGAWRRLADHPATPQQDRVDALSRLAFLLDFELGEPVLAIDVRDELSTHSPADRASTSYQILMALVELGEDEEALAAAIRCARDCDGTDRAAALFVRARLLQTAGRLDEARDAARQARLAPGGEAARQVAAQSFALRAEHFQSTGQRPRARSAASFSLSLDPSGPYAPTARRLLEP